MASFLTTTQISAELENLIKYAKDEITIVSPYLKVNQRLQDFIKDASERQVRVKLIYGKHDMSAGERAWVEQLATVETSFVANLHAKCYLNETVAIVTSMNLYEFSQQNNDEMGILVTEEADPELYGDIHEEVERLRRRAEPKLSKSAETKSSGHCIRCGNTIDLNPDKPLCSTCYLSWVQFKNPYYNEKYCHNCGKESDTTFGRPLCMQCYRANASR